LGLAAITCSNCTLASAILPAFHRTTPWLYAASGLTVPPPEAADSSAAFLPASAAWSTFRCAV
jgi:hypothetical protein